MLNADLLNIILPPLILSILIAFSHAPLGLEVLKKGIIFIDLAIAQIAGLGIIVASVVFKENSLIWPEIISLSFALSAALLFRFSEIKFKKYQEAIIGSSFVLSASIALLLLAKSPNGSEEIHNLLSGQILFVTYKDIITFAPFYLGSLVFIYLYPKAYERIWFYIIFSIIITISVKLCGIYVVFATLILPSLASANTKSKLKTAIFCGLISSSLGILMSVIFNCDTGPTIVISYCITALLFATTNHFGKRFYINTKQY